MIMFYVVLGIIVSIITLGMIILGVSFLSLCKKSEKLSKAESKLLEELIEKDRRANRERR